MQHFETKEAFYFACPHCGISIEVLRTQLNCKIFRCGCYKDTGQPVNPHAPKAVCDDLVRKNLIHGCGKPFTFDGVHVAVCQYI